MRDRPYRTGATWLTDDQLILLDALFDLGAGFGLLRRNVFDVQWNFGYTHALDDDALACNLSWLCVRGVLNAEGEGDSVCYRMTSGGGKLWSRERCPIWARYCIARQRPTFQGRTLMTVVAATPEVRDNFLELQPDYPVDRRRTATLVDYRLVAWRPPARVYVGLAIYKECHRWTASESGVRAVQLHEWRAKLERERSWWRKVPELQRFIPRHAEPSATPNSLQDCTTTARLTQDNSPTRFASIALSAIATAGRAFAIGLLTPGLSRGTRRGMLTWRVYSSDAVGSIFSFATRGGSTATPSKPKTAARPRPIAAPSTDS